GLLKAMCFKRSKQSSRHAFGPAETKGPLKAAFMLSKNLGCEVFASNGILPSAKIRPEKAFTTAAPSRYLAFG
ncbi:MAG: hypothetical protein J7516_15540, partial [Shinella sp.]|nr:hypothetical protein [Shinella sp.]